MRSRSQERRVGSPTEGDDDSAESVELGIEHGQLGIERSIDESHPRIMPELGDPRTPGSSSARERARLTVR